MVETVDRGRDPYPYLVEAAEIGQRGIGNCLNVAVAGSIALWWLTVATTIGEGT